MKLFFLQILMINFLNQLESFPLKNISQQSIESDTITAFINIANKEKPKVINQTLLLNPNENNLKSQNFLPEFFDIFDLNISDQEYFLNDDDEDDDIDEEKFEIYLSKLEDLVEDLATYSEIDLDSLYFNIETDDDISEEDRSYEEELSSDSKLIKLLKKVIHVKQRMEDLKTSGDLSKYRDRQLKHQFIDFYEKFVKKNYERLENAIEIIRKNF
ncbi:unnamed protein product [Brachionus calyciflorus]|uniref:Uncharacterized protein n=1 Tax=Brachionus calyciflorus TaxID=104777 RepID=A0A813URX4_9BILA|nr:unnamed protein product [Brachionus calyciflorus]